MMTTLAQSIWCLLALSVVDSFSFKRCPSLGLPQHSSSPFSKRQRLYEESPSLLSATGASAAAAQQDASGAYLATFDEMLNFPSFEELMKLNAGEYVTSQPFTVSAPPQEDGSKLEYDFCVKLYPRGGGHKAQHSILQSSSTSSNEQNTEKQQESGFGMSYAIVPKEVPKWFKGGASQNGNEKVGVYLQFLPRTPDETVDASFALRLKGRQRLGRRFDVEWRSGIRFVSLPDSKLAQGKANDFGAHLMQTSVLDFFLGINDESFDEIMTETDVSVLENEQLNAKNRREPVQLQVEVFLHKPLLDKAEKEAVARRHLEEPASSDSNKKEGLVSSGFGLLNIGDVRTAAALLQTTESTSTANDDVTEPLRVGRIVVPVLQKLSQRPKMFQQGVYPGVEYRLLRMVDPATERELFYSQPGADYELKPIYPLVQQLERPWPVRVSEGDIPKLITPGQYNLISAVGSALAATSALATAFVISQAISLFFIPSKSMDPTLQKGDVLLVEKVTPRLSNLLAGNNQQVGKVVLFHPPQQLQELVSRSGGRISDRDLFVKERVAAVPGDTFEVVDKAGTVRVNGEEPIQDRTMCGAEPLRLIEQYMNPKTVVVPKGQVAVLGDCSSVSIVGCGGHCPIKGRPLMRIWPISRFGAVDALPTALPGTTTIDTISAITNNWVD